MIASPYVSSVNRIVPPPVQLWESIEKTKLSEKEGSCLRAFSCPKNSKSSKGHTINKASLCFQFLISEFSILNSFFSNGSCPKEYGQRGYKGKCEYRDRHVDGSKSFSWQIGDEIRGERTFTNSPLDDWHVYPRCRISDFTHACASGKKYYVFLKQKKSQVK